MGTVVILKGNLRQLVIVADFVFRQSQYVVQGSLHLKTLLLQTPECWDYSTCQQPSCG